MREVRIEGRIIISQWTRDDYGVKHYDHKPIEDCLARIKWELEQAMNIGNVEALAVEVRICSKTE